MITVNGVRYSDRDARRLGLVPDPVDAPVRNQARTPAQPRNQARNQARTPAAGRPVATKQEAGPPDGDGPGTAG